MSRKRNAGEFRGDFQAVFDLLEADFRALLGERRVLAEAFDQELFVSRHQGVVDGGPAEVDSGYDFHVWLLQVLNFHGKFYTRVERPASAVGVEAAMADHMT